MNNKKSAGFLLPKLLDIVNNATEETSDVIIAKALLECRYELKDLSMENLAARYPVSQPSITRFIKKLGYPSYNSFRSDLQVSDYAMKQIAPPKSGKSAVQIKEKIHGDLESCLKSFDELDPEKMEQITAEILRHRQIWFIGSNLSTSILYLLQIQLIALGYDVYCLQRSAYQEEMLKKMEEDAIVIAVSVEDRWLSQTDAELFGTCKAYTMLWTADTNKDYSEYFDEICIYGEQLKHDMGYHQIMQLVMLLHYLIAEQFSAHS